MSGQFFVEYVFLIQVRPQGLPFLQFLIFLIYAQDTRTIIMSDNLFQMSQPTILAIRESENDLRNQPWVLFSRAFDHVSFFSRRLHPDTMPSLFSAYVALFGYYQEHLNMDNEDAHDETKSYLYTENGWRATITNNQVTFTTIPHPKVRFPNVNNTAACA